jgi:hypothetical protein
MFHWRKDSYIDVINLILGIALFVSPWFLGYTGGTVARTAWIGGFLIAAAALLALANFAEWEEWANLIFGLGVLFAPWLWGFAGTSMEATQIHLVVGVVVAALSAWELWRTHSSPPGLAA